MTEALSARREPTAAEVMNAALKWCGAKERETDTDDIRYFKDNWRALPGLRVYVDRETNP